MNSTNFQANTPENLSLSSRVGLPQNNPNSTSHFLQRESPNLNNRDNVANQVIRNNSILLDNEVLQVPLNMDALRATRRRVEDKEINRIQSLPLHGNLVDIHQNSLIGNVSSYQYNQQQEDQNKIITSMMMQQRNRTNISHHVLQENLLLSRALEQSIKTSNELAIKNADLKNKIIYLQEQKDGTQQELSQIKEMLSSKDKGSSEPFNKHEENWYLRYSELKEYKNQYGSCLVPQRYPKCPALGIWVATQRQAYHTYRLSEDRVSKLSSIGFVWDARNMNKNDEKD